MENKAESLLHPIPKPGEYHFKEVPLDDPRVWALFARGLTKGVFQLEKQLGKDWSKKAKPRNISELACLISILRPGVLQTGQAQVYVDRKNGVKPIEYFHPALESILKDTYGCLVYQEQSMAIAMKLSNFDETQADTYIRKGLAKKQPEVISEARKMFIEGAKIKGIITEEEAKEIFSWIEKGQRYLFNASHSHVYSKISYFTAYQKTHFPLQFFTSWLRHANEKIDPKEEIFELVSDAKLFNIKILPPDIRKKNIDFEIAGEKEIIFGLKDIRSIGGASLKVFSDPNVDLSSFNGFLQSSKKLKKTVAEALIKSGACDCYGHSRSWMLRCTNTIFGRKNDETDDTPLEFRPLTNKELNVFIPAVANVGIIEAYKKVISDAECTNKRIPAIEAKIKFLSEECQDTNKFKAIFEKLYLGVTLTCSAADDYEREQNSKTCRYAYSAEDKARFTLHVVIDDIKEKVSGEKSKTPGKKYCYLTVSDNTLSLSNVVAWADKYEQIKDDISEGAVVSIKARKNNWSGRDYIVIEDLKLIG